MALNTVRDMVRAVVVPVIAAGLAALLIIAIGEALLALFEAGRPELERRELWFGVALSLIVLAIGAFVATRPRSDGPLDRPVALGKKSMFAPPPMPLDIALRRGRIGTIDDVQPGDTLYARSGALAQAIGLVPGGEEHGIRYRGYIYASGLHGASDELWIPVEAVTAVYPETNSVFLAIKGDETEAFGWDRPPAHFRRTERPSGPPKGL